MKTTPYTCCLGHEVELNDTEINQMYQSKLLDDNEKDEIEETGIIPTEFCPICKAEGRNG